MTRSRGPFDIAQDKARDPPVLSSSVAWECLPGGSAASRTVARGKTVKSGHSSEGSTVDLGTTSKFRGGQ